MWTLPTPHIYITVGSTWDVSHLNHKESLFYLHSQIRVHMQKLQEISTKILILVELCYVISW